MAGSSLRTRIALLCALVTALAVAGSGYFVLRYVEEDLRAAVDEVLLERSAAFGPEVVEIIRRQDGLIGGLAPALGGSPVRGSVDGDSAFVLGPVPPVAIPTPGDGDRFDTVSVGGSTWRRYSVVVEAPSAPVLVEVFEPLDPTLARESSIRRQAGAIGAIAVALGALLGYVAALSATRGLRRLVEQAASVGPGSVYPDAIEAGGSTSEVRDLEAALNAMLDRIHEAMAETSGALASSRSFAADVAHELRTPLAAMATNIEILLRHPDIDAATRDQIVVELDERQIWMGRLIESLQALTRAELADPGGREPVDLVELVDGVLAAEGLPRDGDRVWVVSEGAAEVVGSPDHLRVLVDNLVRNAVVHGCRPDGGIDLLITVTSTGSKGGDGDRPPAARLRVEDGGPGVPRSDRQRILDRFERGHAPDGRPGLGLGLALVEQLARIHDGELVVSRSERLGGAQFEVTLWSTAADGPVVDRSTGLSQKTHGSLRVST